MLSHSENDKLFLRVVDMLRFGFDINSLPNKDEILARLYSMKFEDGSFEQKMISDYKTKASRYN